MHLLPHSTGVAAILPRELIAPTMDALRRFVLRAKVKIEDGGDALSVAGLHGAQGLASCGLDTPSGSAYIEKDGIGVATVNGDGSRYWVIGTTRGLAERRLTGDASQVEKIEHHWRLADIRAGLPQIYLATREVFVAQMLNLDLLDGISFSKGCYTGQEIIARTQHLGRIKRRLYRLRLPPGDWHIGAPLRLSDGRAGRIVEAIRDGEGFEALAVLNLQAGVSANTHTPVNSATANITTVPNAGTGAASPSVAEAEDGDAATSAPVSALPLPLPYAL